MYGIEDKLLTKYRSSIQQTSVIEMKIKDNIFYWFIDKSLIYEINVLENGFSMDSLYLVIGRTEPNLKIKVW